MQGLVLGAAGIGVGLVVAAFSGSVVAVLLHLCAGAGGFYIAYRIIKEW